MSLLDLRWAELDFPVIVLGNIIEKISLQQESPWEIRINTVPMLGRP